MSVEVLERQPSSETVDDSPSFDGIGILAEFADPDQLVSAARRTREAGYVKTDAFTPFPIHQLDEALAIRPTILPWIALVVGISGGAGALAMQWWMNAVDYPILISGKPMFSLPANIPVTFEVIILSAAFAAFGGMLLLNRLPQLSNALLENQRFLRATDDGFFLFIASEDPMFQEAAVRQHLRAVGATHLEVVLPTTSPKRPPSIFYGMGAVAVALATVPPVLIFWARNTTSELPRIDFFADMDSQRSFKPQEASKLFADGRAMRPQVPGTIAVGDLEDDSAFYMGILEGVAAAEPPKDGAADGEPDDSHYVTEFPVSITESLMQRGQKQFNVYCAPCHGLAGQGDGLVSLRAIELQESTWVPPSNLTNRVVAAQPVGKLFETISKGRRKMGGLESQIEPRDRWAIVLYLRALQRSQNATLDDVPEAKAEILETQR